jgi:hypothetical protein
MARTPPPRRPASPFDSDSDSDSEELPDPRETVRRITAARRERGTAATTTTKKALVVFTSDEESGTEDVTAWRTSTINRGSTTTTLARKQMEAPKRELVDGYEEEEEDDEKEEEEEEELGRGDNTRPHSPKIYPKTKLVFFTEDEENEAEDVPAAVGSGSSTSTEEEYVSAPEDVEEEEEEEEKELSPPPRPQSQSHGLPGTPEPKPEKLHIFTSDEESSPETTKRSKEKPRAGEKNRETRLEDMFSRATISETPAKKKPARTPAKKSKYDPIFDSSSDDDSDPEAWKEFKTPAKPVRRKTKKPSLFEDIISRFSEEERDGASSDDLKKATITLYGQLPPSCNTVANRWISPGFMKPLTPRRGPIEPKTPRKDGGGFKSPEKKLPRIPSVPIPPTPYQEIHDEFWDQETTDRWNDEHSPHKKPSRAPSKEIIYLSSDSESECDSDNWIVNDDDRYRTPGKRTAKTPAKPPGTAARAAKKDWNARKTDLALQFIKDMDREIEDGAVGKFYADKGGVKLEWNAKLRTTAGRASMNRGVIELCPKVITTERKFPSPRLLLPDKTHRY